MATVVKREQPKAAVMQVLYIYIYTCIPFQLSLTGDKNCCFEIEQGCLLTLAMIKLYMGHFTLFNISDKLIFGELQDRYLHTLYNYYHNCFYCKG